MSAYRIGINTGGTLGLGSGKEYLVLGDEARVVLRGNRCTGAGVEAISSMCCSK